jgi:hypothetical protein
MGGLGEWVRVGGGCGVGGRVTVVRWVVLVGIKICFFKCG